MIDITEENLENSYNQVRTELGKYSKKLLKKSELIVLNKTDLLEKEGWSPIFQENYKICSKKIYYSHTTS